MRRISRILAVAIVLAAVVGAWQPAAFADYPTCRSECRAEWGRNGCVLDCHEDDYLGFPTLMYCLVYCDALMDCCMDDCP